jgi:hypothetical protein
MSTQVPLSVPIFPAFPSHFELPDKQVPEPTEDQQIQELSEVGDSADEIALALGLTDQAVLGVLTPGSSSEAAAPVNDSARLSLRV